MLRRLEPEWLDELPPHDPRAIRSRYDLRRINALMMNATIIACALDSLRVRAPAMIAEIGAGDGTFMLRLAEKIGGGNVHAVLLDRQDAVSIETQAKFFCKGWRAEAVTMDVFDWLARQDSQVFDVMIANLFLHHFDEIKLKALLSLIAQRTRAFIACEPRRAVLALTGSRLLGVLGYNKVSRHDAVVSVRAGFDGRELSALWPAGPVWKLQERARGLFSHCFVASRVAANSAVEDEKI